MRLRHKLNFNKNHRRSQSHEAVFHGPANIWNQLIGTLAWGGGNGWTKTHLLALSWVHGSWQESWEEQNRKEDCLTQGNLGVSPWKQQSHFPSAQQESCIAVTLPLTPPSPYNRGHMEDWARHKVVPDQHRDTSLRINHILIGSGPMATDTAPA